MFRACVLGLGLAAILGAAAVPADARIYWANRAGSTIGSAYLDGSSATNLIDGANGANAVAADEQHVFWAEETSNRVGWANADGSAIDHAIISAHAFGLAVQGTKIYWGTGTDMARATISAPVAAVENPLITGVGTTYGIAADSGHVYWPDEFSNRIGRATLAGGDVQYAFITGTASPLGVAVDSGHLYWTSPAGIGRSDLDGTNVNTAFISLVASAWSVAVDAKHVYWTALGADAIGRANLDGSGIDETFITGLAVNDPFGIAVNGAPRDTGGALSLTGTAQVAAQLTCDRSAWNPSGDPMTYVYAWLREGSAIAGQTASTYTLAAADAGTNVACRVTASNGGGDLTTTSASVYVPVPPSSAGAPVISGTIEAGQQVTCSTGAWYGEGPLTYLYTWLVNGVPITGANAATYVITGADQRQTLSCLVEATGPGGQASATSAGVVVPELTNPPAPPRNVQLPAISGIAMVGNLLTCAPGAWTSASAFSYAWLRDGTVIMGLSSTSYAAVAADAGHQVACRVTAAGAAGTASADSLSVLIAAAPDNLTPRLTGLALKPTVFRAARKGASIAVHTVTGTRVRYTLSKSATVIFRVARRNDKGRYVALKGRFRRASTAGANHLRFTGRLAGRRLRPGRYQLRARPRDSAGRLGTIRREAFRVVR